MAIAAGNGLFAAAGLILMNDRRVNFGFEISTDLSKVEFEEKFEGYDPYTSYPIGDHRYKSLQPGKLLISLFIQF